MILYNKWFRFYKAIHTDRDCCYIEGLHQIGFGYNKEQALLNLLVSISVNNARPVYTNRFNCQYDSKEK